MSKEPMSDSQYRERFITALTARLETDAHLHYTPARSIAIDLYEHCPRSEMSEEYASDPEEAAEEAYIEWDDDTRRENDEPFEDDEWDGDEGRE